MLLCAVLSFCTFRGFPLLFFPSNKTVSFSESNLSLYPSGTRKKELPLTFTRKKKIYRIEVDVGYFIFWQSFLTEAKGFKKGETLQTTFEGLLKFFFSKFSLLLTLSWTCEQKTVFLIIILVRIYFVDALEVVCVTGKKKLYRKNTQANEVILHSQFLLSLAHHSRKCFEKCVGSEKRA